MKYISQISTLIIVCFLSFNIASAQKTISKEYKEKTINSLSQLMNDFYVFPEVAKLTETHLKTLLKEGYFDQFNNNKTFAEALTESVQKINNDKHMRIRVEKPFVAPENTSERLVEERLDRLEAVRAYNSGFSSVKVLEGNVGYLDLRGFDFIGRGKARADAYMALIAQTDAVIIDLSKNGGGDPAMVQYLCSYFFENKIHLNSLYFREGDRTEEFWTLEKIDGDKRPEVPLFVITSEKTFSGAEEFAYNMQTQKRATLIGVTSGGGANPGGTMSINEKLSVFIPGGKAINPITLTNWEGVGVIPEVKTNNENAIDKAHELAKVAAQKYKKSKTEVYSKLLSDLYAIDDKSNTDEIILAIEKCHAGNLLKEREINILGYDYLMEYKKPKIAVIIFKANTIYYPNSANVFDSYGEALMINGDLDLSLLNYQKAVEIAKENGDENIKMFEESLDKIKAKIKDKN